MKNGKRILKQDLALIRANMSLGQSIPSEGILRLTYVTNTGGAFGLFANHTLPLILTAILAVVVLFLYYRHLPLENHLFRTALGLQLGGAAGNLIDRLYSGRVTDFIDIGMWPVFNLADSAIVIGVIIVVFLLLFGSRVKRRVRK